MRATHGVPPLVDLTEREWQTQVIQLARTLGWTRIYHTHDSRRSQHGFPDLVLVRDRVIYLELKRETGKLSDHQREWLRALRLAGADAFIARPSDLSELALLLQLGRRAASDLDLRADRELRVPAD